jgi:hypothetical protein
MIHGGKLWLGLDFADEARVGELKISCKSIVRL